MSTMATLLGAESAPQEVMGTDGKTRKAGPITDAVKTAWERWLQGKARATLEETCRGMSAEAQGLAAVSLAERLAGPEYSFYGPRSVEEMKNLDGISKMASLIFGIPHAEAAALMKEKPVEVLAVVLVAYRESLGGIPAAMDGLKAKADAAAGVNPSPNG